VLNLPHEVIPKHEHRREELASPLGVMHSEGSYSSAIVDNLPTKFRHSTYAGLA
jgi:hypothetical protein